MIPLALVTGFLGSGKTTFLRRTIERQRGRRIVYLVNEFSTVDVDGHLLELEPDRLITVAGGSIFCRCLVTDFLAQLRKIESRAADGIDGVVIEASGIADPKVMRQMLAETRFDRAFKLGMIVSIVDPGSFVDLLETLPNIVAQIEAADVAIINKSDLYAADVIDDTRRELLRINAGLRIERATYCDVALDLFASPPRREQRGEYAACADANYVTLSVRIERELDVGKLMGHIERIHDQLYRVKGFAPHAGGLTYVDVSPATIATEAAPDRGQPRELVLIARAAGRARVYELVELIETGGLYTTPA